MWRLTTDTNWRNSGDIASGLIPGQLVVQFKGVTGWIAPSNQTQTITAGQSTSLTGTYTNQEQTGSLMVTVAPQGAIDAGAQWNIDGGAWNDSGTTDSGLSVGQHTVTFKDVPGWTKPANQIINISANETYILPATYSQVSQPSSLTVIIIPQEALDAGAKWTIDGGITWNNSGATVTDLAPGQYILEFSIVSGWTKPESRTVDIATGESEAIEEEYTELQQPEFTITANDPNASESQKTGLFTVSRSGDTSKKLKVYYTVSGSATNGKDYRKLNGKVTIKRGSSTAIITVKPKNDKIAEDDETVTVILSNGENATVTITDND